MITVRDLLSVDNPSARKFWAMGFRLQEFELRELDYGPWAARGRFVCACGRAEVFQQILPQWAPIQHSQAVIHNHMNAYVQIERFGSLDRQHLLGDGYEPATVDRMLERGQDEILGAMMTGVALTHMVFDEKSMRLDMPNHAQTYAMMLEHRKPQPPELKWVRDPHHKHWMAP